MISTNAALLWFTLLQAIDHLASAPAYHRRTIRSTTSWRALNNAVLCTLQSTELTWAPSLSACSIVTINRIEWKLCIEIVVDIAVARQRLFGLCGVRNLSRGPRLPAKPHLFVFAASINLEANKKAWSYRGREEDCDIRALRLSNQGGKIVPAGAIVPSAKNTASTPPLYNSSGI
jgi:hypothetical protein